MNLHYTDYQILPLRRTRMQKNAKLQEGITSVQSLGEVKLNITAMSVAPDSPG